jgi:uncharacterized protein
VAGGWSVSNVTEITGMASLSRRPAARDHAVTAAGLGLRRAHFDDLLAGIPADISFMEVAPENWIEVGGKGGKQFCAIAEQVPLVCHGLALNIGGLAPLDEIFLGRIKQFLDTHHVRYYSDHLSYSADHGQLYDLLPIPFTWEAAQHVARRIRQVQDILERPLAIENVSYYAAPGREIAEIDFINAVLEEADCLLHLDINNIYVNSVNHGFDPREFLRALPGQRIAYAHIAGHFKRAEDLIIDTHGADVIAPVWELLDLAYREFGVFPTLLERDFDLPALADMLPEVAHIRAIQAKFETTSSDYTCQQLA